MGIAFCVWIVYNKITPAVCVGSHILNHNFYKGLRVRAGMPSRLVCGSQNGRQHLPTLFKYRFRK
jgi:hypothetical protein